MSILATPQKIVVGVSAGADSMALWHWLVMAGHEVVACYVHHHQRPQENVQEIACIERQAAKLNSRYVLTEITPEALAAQTGNFQNFARQQRYAIWQTVLKQEQTPYLALAHHSDDLLETVFMRLVRGTSPQGVIAFQPEEQRATYWLLRPFYTWTKADIYAYCQHHEIEYCEDSSNEKLIYTRNRFRHGIIPQLQQENPHVSKHVRSFIDQLQQIETYLHGEAEKIASEIVERRKNYVRVSINLLKNKPIALQTAVFKIILRYVYLDSDYSWNEILLTRLLEMVEKSSGSEQFIWQQRTFERNYTQLYIYQTEVKNSRLTGLSHSVTPIQFGDYTIQFTETILPPTLQTLAIPTAVWQQLCIRTPEANDVVTLANGQHKKLSRLFIDQKVPRFLRANWPVVTYRGELIWVYQLWQAASGFAPEQITGTVIIKEDYGYDS